MDELSAVGDPPNAPSAVPRELRIRVRVPSIQTALIGLTAVAVIVYGVLLQRQVSKLRSDVGLLRASAAADTSQIGRYLRQYEIETVIEGYAPTVDLRDASLASIGDGFSVGQLAVEAVPGGAKISGLIVNEQAVSHRAADFKITAGGQSSDLSVMSIPAGGSAHFDVVISGVVADSVRWGTIKYQRSTVSYQRP